MIQLSQTQPQTLMAITRNISGESCELLVQGRIDSPTAGAMEVELLSLTRQPLKVINVNLSGSDYICSAGIRVLLQTYRQMRNQGKRFVVTKPSPEIESILDLTGFKEQLVEAN
jgi:anti-anti-sigma factor